MKMKVACGRTGRSRSGAGCLGRAWKAALGEYWGKHSDTPQAPDDTRTLELVQPLETSRQPIQPEPLAAAILAITVPFSGKK